jgi:hypothetical protein
MFFYKLHGTILLFSWEIYLLLLYAITDQLYLSGLRRRRNLSRAVVCRVLSETDRRQAPCSVHEERKQFTRGGHEIAKLLYRSTVSSFFSAFFI